MPVIDRDVEFADSPGALLYRAPDGVVRRLDSDGTVTDVIQGGSEILDLAFSGDRTQAIVIRDGSIEWFDTRTGAQLVSVRGTERLE